MRVLYVSQSLGKGGAEKQLSLLADHLRRLGYESEVTALSGGGYWTSYLKDKNVSVSALDFPPGTRVRLKTLREFARLVSHIRRSRPDAVISFLYPCSIWASLAARLAGVPVIIASRRDCGFQRAELALPRWMEKLSYRATTRFVANSMAVLQSLRQNEGIDPEKVTIIYNGIDVPEIKAEERCALRRRLGIPESALVVGMVANFWPHKNQHILVRAAARVVSRDSNVLFLLAGRYWDYQKQVEAEIKNLAMEQHIRIVGQVESASDILPALDIGVLCSESEGFSNTILEYMAYGKPVVATRVGGNPEAILEGETGRLVEPGNSVDLADAILSLTGDPDRRAAMGSRGRARVEEEFRWEMVLKGWDSLLRRLSSEQ